MVISFALMFGAIFISKTIKRRNELMQSVYGTEEGGFSDFMLMRIK